MPARFLVQWSPDDAQMRQWIVSPSVPVIGWLLLGTKPTKTYQKLRICRLNHQEHMSVKLESKYEYFFFQKDNVCEYVFWE